MIFSILIWVQGFNIRYEKILFIAQVIRLQRPEFWSAMNGVLRQVAKRKRSVAAPLKSSDKCQSQKALNPATPCGIIVSLYTCAGLRCHFITPECWDADGYHACGSSDGVQQYIFSCSISSRNSSTVLHASAVS